MNSHTPSEQNDSSVQDLQTTLMSIALVGAFLLCGFQFHERELTGVGFAWRVLLATFLGAGAGRLLGVALVRFRRTRIR